MYCLPWNTHTPPRVDTGSCRSARTSDARLIQNCNQQINARLKGLCWPAKQAYFAVRSIGNFDWPRVGASQKLIPRKRLTRQNRGGGEEERSFFLFFPPLPPCLLLLHVPLARAFEKKPPALRARTLSVSWLSVSFFQIANCASFFALERINDSGETGK